MQKVQVEVLTFRQKGSPLFPQYQVCASKLLSFLNVKHGLVSLSVHAPHAKQHEPSFVSSFFLTAFSTAVCLVRVAHNLRKRRSRISDNS